MIKRILTVIVALVLITVVTAILYLFLPLRVETEWDTSPDTRVIKVRDYFGESDYNDIPDAQVWGDGRIIWVERRADGERRVLEGYLSDKEMLLLITQLIDAGFFKGYRRFPSWNIEFGRWLNVNLANDYYEVLVIPLDPRLKYDNEIVLDLVDFLKSGAGTTGVDFTPTVGRLIVYPVEDTSLPADAKAEYHWPDDEFGYGLEAVYTNKPHNERLITGEELSFAWGIVNSPTPLVESRGKVYWIAVVVPNVSSFGS